MDTFNTKTWIPIQEEKQTPSKSVRSIGRKTVWESEMNVFKKRLEFKIFEQSY
jgi:hypothetical protein